MKKLKGYEEQDNYFSKIIKPIENEREKVLCAIKYLTLKITRASLPYYKNKFDKHFIDFQKSLGNDSTERALNLAKLRGDDMEDYIREDNGQLNNHFYNTAARYFEDRAGKYYYENILNKEDKEEWTEYQKLLRGFSGQEQAVSDCSRKGLNRKLFKTELNINI